MESFRETSDRLSALGISLQDQAEALGVQYQTLRSMRAEPGSKSYRTPPERSNWSSAWATLLRERARDMESEADTLDQEAEVPSRSLAPRDGGLEKQIS